MEMHPYYTEVPRRSFEAIVKNGWLSEILLALVTDPLEAEDLAERLERGTGESLWVLPAAKGQRRYLAPTSVGDFHKLNIEAKTSWRVTMAQWVMHFEDARPAIKSSIEYDRRLGVWCACQVARETLRLLPYGEVRPLRSIEATEAWVCGKATAAQVHKAARSANAASLTRAVAAVYAADATADDASYAAASATLAAANAAASADNVTRSTSWAEKRDEELVRLREVVANACMTFPM